MGDNLRGSELREERRGKRYARGSGCMPSSSGNNVPCKKSLMDHASGILASWGSEMRGCLGGFPYN